MEANDDLRTLGLNCSKGARSPLRLTGGNLGLGSSPARAAQAVAQIATVHASNGVHSASSRVGNFPPDRCHSPESCRWEQSKHGKLSNSTTLGTNLCCLQRAPRRYMHRSQAVSSLLDWSVGRAHWAPMKATTDSPANSLYRADDTKTAQQES